MPRLTACIPFAAAALMLTAPAAQAAQTRASSAIPAALQPGAPAAPAAKAQGPRGGFPVTPGTDRAREVADEHARFLRPDSQG